MSLKQKLTENKTAFYRIFDQETKKNIGYIPSGKQGYDHLIDTHLKAWIASRIHGGSASMVFYAEVMEAIKLIDKLAKEYFGQS